MTAAGLGALFAIVAVAAGQYAVWLRSQRRAGRRHPRAAGREATEPADRLRPTEPVDRAALWIRRHKAARRALPALVGLLALLAIAVIAYPLFTDMYTNRLQSRLSDQLDTAGLRHDYRNHAVKVGDALTRLKIPSIGVDVVVVEGTTTSALRAGAGHYPQTPLPCAVGNVGIAGHRTTYGKPFHDLQKLHPGDAIVLETPVGRCTYHLNKPPFQVRPAEVEVLDPDSANPSTLTLTTCDPPGSAARRLIAQATIDPAASEPAAP